MNASFLAAAKAKALRDEAQAFFWQEPRDKAQGETEVSAADRDGALRRERIVQQNLALLHAKVDEMDQIGQAVNVGPQKRTWMPQMNNKKRYSEVQRVVSPNKEKGQKPFHMFREDAFVKNTLAEGNIAGRTKAKELQMRRARPKTTGTVMAPKPTTAKQARDILRYEKRLNTFRNIQGGGALVNGRTHELRAILDEIVRGYPMVN